MDDTIKITFIDLDNTEIEVEENIGLTVYEAAIFNDIENLPCVCGGEMSCASCHVYVEDDWIDKTGPCSGDEKIFLRIMSDDVKENSRLGCQIILTEELDGIRLRIAPNDYNH